MKNLLISTLFLLAMMTPVNAETLFRFEDPWPPFVILTDSTPSGFSVEIFEAMLQNVPNMDVKYSFYPWKRLLVKVAKQPNSFTFLGRTKKREQEFKWVGPILFMEMAIFKLRSRTDLKVNVLTDLKSYKIGMPRGYSIKETLIELGIKEEQIEEVNKGEQNVKKLFSGRINFIVENPLVVAHYVKKEGHQIRQLKKIVIINEFKREDNYFGFNVDTDDRIIQQLQKALDQIKQNGKYNSILNKYTN